ncbi:MAG: Gfo/Idh/MocA family oxidoreductase [Kiritimatiellia bacterium]|nr:Gfo/Idh/MocA family oxidoreductase [Kiritimatiellia bacterium]
MTLRIGIVGCGSIAEAMHIPAAKNVEDVELTTLIDADAVRSEELAAKHDVPFSGKALADVVDQLDAAVVCTPPHLHLPLVEDAFAKGLHVLCEKPLANTLKECEAMVAAGKQAGRTLAMAHIFRFYPVRREMKRIIEQRRFGALVSVHIEQGNPYSWKSVTGYNMRRELVPGGVLIDAGIHPLDTMLWWCGDPRSISYKDDALGGLESNASMDLDFAGGVKGHLRISRTAQLCNLFRLTFETATVVLTPYSTGEYTVVERDRKEACIAPGGDVKAADCAHSQMRDFARSVIDNREPLVSAEEGERCIRTIEEAYRMRDRRPLPSKAPTPGLTW